MRCLTGGGNESRDERHLLRFSLVFICCSCFKVSIEIITILLNEYLEIENESYFKENMPMKNFLIVMQIKVYICSFIFLFLFFTLKCEYKFGKCLKYNFLVKKFVKIKLIKICDM